MLVKLIFICFVFLSVTAGQQNKIKTFTLKSKIFNNERTIRVLLPKEYNGKNALKVLYLNDGQNLFGDNDFGSEYEWRVDEVTDSLISNKIIDPIIIVGIDHTKEFRDSEYVPWQDEYRNPPLPNPEGKKYPEFLIKEVMPLIEKKFNVLKGPENTGIGGASHGGLISLYTSILNSDKFGFVIAESPSLYVNKYKIFETVKNSAKNSLNKIYVGMGTNESAIKPCDENFKYNKLAVNDTKHLKDIFSDIYPSSSLYFYIDSCATHHELSWSKRFPEALKFVLNKN